MLAAVLVASLGVSQALVGLPTEEIRVKRCGVSVDKRFVSDSWLKGIVWSAELVEGAVLRDVRSPYQQVSVVETVSLGRALVLDGALQCAERDERGYHEMLAHVPLLRRRGRRRGGSRVLIIGGGDGGIAREVLRHDEVRAVDMVEIDQVVVEAARDLMPRLWPASVSADERFRLYFEDAAAFVQKTPPETYDVVIVDASDPIGPGQRLYTPAFYADLAKALRPRGAVVAQAGSFFYLPRVFRTVYHGFANAGFSVVEPYSCFTAVYPGGLWNLVVATRGDDPKRPDRRRAARFSRQHQLHFYDAHAHAAAFALPPLARAELAKPPPTLDEVAADLAEIYGGGAAG